MVPNPHKKEKVGNQVIRNYLNSSILQKSGFQTPIATLKQQKKSGNEAWLSSCPGREHFCMLIISVLQNFQAETQAILECHNFWMVAPNKGSKINGKVGDEPVFFYEPFIREDVSVVDVIVRICQESIERPMDRIVFP